MAIATEAIQRDARLAGRNLAERFSGNSKAELSRIVNEVWAQMVMQGAALRHFRFSLE